MSCRLLADALQRSKRFQAVPAVTPTEVLQALHTVAFDLVLLGAKSAGDPPSGFALLREIQGLHPGTSIVVLLDSLERQSVVEAFRSGAHGVFCRTDSFQTLCKCLACVHDGQVWASSAELQFLLEALTGPLVSEGRGLSGRRPLSKREEEVAKLVAQGLSNRQISVRMALSEHTVKNYLFRVFEKLEVSTRVELALHALKHGHLRRFSPQATKPESPAPRLVKAGKSGGLR